MPGQETNHNPPLQPPQAPPPPPSSSHPPPAFFFSGADEEEEEGSSTTNNNNQHIPSFAEFVVASWGCPKEKGVEYEQAVAVAENILFSRLQSMGEGNGGDGGGEEGAARRAQAVANDAAAAGGGCIPQNIPTLTSCKSCASSVKDDEDPNVPKPPLLEHLDDLAAEYFSRNWDKIDEMVEVNQARLERWKARQAEEEEVPTPHAELCSRRSCRGSGSGGDGGSGRKRGRQGEEQREGDHHHASAPADLPPAFASSSDVEDEEEESNKKSKTSTSSPSSSSSAGAALVEIGEDAIDLLLGGLPGAAVANGREALVPELDEAEIILLEVYSEHCPACHRLRPSLEQAAQHFKEDPRVLIACVEGPAHPAFLERLDVQWYPTLKIVDRPSKTIWDWPPVSAGGGSGASGQNVIDILSKYLERASAVALASLSRSSSSASLSLLPTSGMMPKLRGGGVGGGGGGEGDFGPVSGVPLEQSLLVVSPRLSVRKGKEKEKGEEKRGGGGSGGGRGAEEKDDGSRCATKRKLGEVVEEKEDALKTTTPTAAAAPASTTSTTTISSSSPSHKHKDKELTTSTIKEIEKEKTREHVLEQLAKVPDNDQPPSFSQLSELKNELVCHRDLASRRKWVSAMEIFRALGCYDEKSCRALTRSHERETDEPPHLILLGGGMGAGKSTLKKMVIQSDFWRRHGQGVVSVEADHFKACDPVYQLLTRADLPKASEQVHNYSTQAAEELFLSALIFRRDIVFDSTLAWAPFLQQTLDMVRDTKHTYKRGPGYVELPSPTKGKSVGNGDGGDGGGGSSSSSNNNSDEMKLEEEGAGAGVGGERNDPPCAHAPTTTTTTTNNNNNSSNGAIRNGAHAQGNTDTGMVLAQEKYWEVDGTIPPDSQPVPYRVELVGVYVRPEVAVRRAIIRRLLTGRGVPVRDQLRSHALFAKNFETFALCFDTVVLYDNNRKHGRGDVLMDPRVIAKKDLEDDELQVLDEEAFKAFQAVAHINVDATSVEELYHQQAK